MDQTIQSCYTCKYHRNASAKECFDCKQSIVNGVYVCSEWIFAPETIELNGKKYLKSELEEALKHIRPVE